MKRRFIILSILTLVLALGGVYAAYAWDPVAVDLDPLVRSNATVEIQIGGPGAVSLNSNPSGTDGYAYASWGTQAPNRKGQGGTAPERQESSDNGGGH